MNSSTDINVICVRVYVCVLTVFIYFFVVVILNVWMLLPLDCEIKMHISVSVCVSIDQHITSLQEVTAAGRRCVGAAWTLSERLTDDELLTAVHLPIIGDDLRTLLLHRYTQYHNNTQWLGVPLPTGEGLCRLPRKISDLGPKLIKTEPINIAAVKTPYVIVIAYSS